MIYGVEQKVTVKSMEMDGPGYAEHIDRSLFDGMANEMHKNLAANITINEDQMQQVRTHQLRLLVFNQYEFNNKINKLKVEISGLSIDRQNRILDIFRKDSEEDHKRGKPQH